jgi:iron complex outermembrane receptor protein
MIRNLLLNHFAVSVQTLFLLWCLLPSGTLAQQGKRTALNGRLVDAENQPIEAATVILNKGQQVAETDPNGRFTLFLPPGTDSLRLEIRSMGFRNIDTLLSASAVKGQVLEFRPTALYVSTEDVVISEKFAQKIEQSAVSTAILSARSIDQMASSDLKTAVTQLPGVTLTAGQLSIRGSSGWGYGTGSRVVGVLNGMPLMLGDEGKFDWYALPNDWIRQVEVVKGASSVLYGTGALGGVVHAITKDPTDKPETVVRLRYHVFDQPRNDSVRWTDTPQMGYSMHVTHGRRIAQVWDFAIMADMINAATFRAEEKETRGRLMIFNKVRIKSVPGLQFGLNAQWQRDSTRENVFWNDYPTGALRPNRDFQGFWANERWLIDPSVTYTWRNHQFLYQGRIFNRTWLNRPDTAWDDRAAKKYKLINRNYGTTTYYNDLQAKHSLWNDRLILVEGLNYTRTNFAAGVDKGVGWVDQASVYMQAKLQLGRLNITAGGRMQYEGITGDTTPTKSGDPNLYATTMLHPIFRGGINYRLGKATYLRASAGQAVRSPSPVERFIQYSVGPIKILPSPDVQLETGWTAEVSARQLFPFRDSARFSGYVDAALFTQQFTNMVEFYADEQYLFTNQEIAFRSQNLSKASINGVELETGLEWKPSRNWRVGFSGGLTLIDPRDPNGKDSWNGDDSTQALINAAIGVLGESLLPGVFPRPSVFPQDRPAILKYRNRLTTRANLTIGWKGLTFMVLHRYSSGFENVDKLLLMDLQNARIPTTTGGTFTLTPQLLEAIGFGRLFSDTRTYRANNPLGYHEFDMSLAYRYKFAELSLFVANVFNAEFAAFPGQLNPQRSYTLQLRLNF